MLIRSAENRTAAVTRITANDVGGTRIDPSDFVRLENIHAVDEAFGPAKLKGLWSIASTFERCSFDDIRVDDAHFGSGMTRSLYLDCTFDRSDIRAPAMGWARFERCSFRDVRLRRWDTAADFVDCVFTGRADGCVFHGRSDDPITGTPLRPVEFEGNDFAGMEFRDVVFRGGIDLRRQLLPRGPDDLYVEDAAEALARARRRVRECDDPDRREDALLDVDSLQLEVDAHGQDQLYVRASDLEPDPITRALLVEALRG